MQTVRMALRAFARRNERNVLVEWLTSLQWDGKPRCERFLIDAFGAPSDPYHHAVGSRFLRSLVARATRPGCQQDHMMVLEGLQGIGKSTALRALAEPYFSELHEQIGSLRWQELIQGIWLGELGELNALRAVDVQRVIGAISNRSDRFRPAYAANPVQMPRRIVLVGTTNSDDWISDPTGSRRYWPVRCEKADLDYIRANREQLFAEALRDINEGGDWYQVPEAEARAHQAQRFEGDPLEERIAMYCESRDYVTSGEIMEALDFASPQMTRAMQNRIGLVLRSMGWQKTVRNGRKCYRAPFKYQPEPPKKAPPTSGASRPVEGGANVLVDHENPGEAALGGDPLEF